MANLMGKRPGEKGKPKSYRGCVKKVECRQGIIIIPLFLYTGNSQEFSIKSRPAPQQQLVVIGCSSIGPEIFDFYKRDSLVCFKTRQSNNCLILILANLKASSIKLYKNQTYNSMFSYALIYSNQLSPIRSADGPPLSLQKGVSYSILSHIKFPRLLYDVKTGTSSCNPPAVH